MKRCVTGAWQHGVARLGACAVLCAASCTNIAIAQMGQGVGAADRHDRTPGAPNVTPEPLKGVELRNKLGAAVPLDLTFTASSGSTVQLKDLFGKQRPVVLAMMYYRCPMLCPMVMDNLTRQMRGVDFALGKEYDAVIVSFDPKDTVADGVQMKRSAIASYLKDRERPAEANELAEIERGFTFLSGDAAQSATLAESVGFGYRYIPETEQYAHGAVIFVLTPEGKVSRYITDLSGSSRDLRLALVDASSGTIGSWSDQLMLRCFHFNPADGKYSMTIMFWVKVAALLGTASLGGLIAYYLHRERRTRKAGGTRAVHALISA